MMKAIIFDVDNTLIEWRSEFIFALSNVIKRLNYNYNEDTINRIDKAIEDYDKFANILTKESLLDFINKECNLNLDLKFIDELESEQCKCFYKDDKLKDMLERLSKKYDLYVISNWFTKTQKKRLENMDIAKYFKLIIGSDKNYYKPNKKAYDIILKDYFPGNIISVGDDLEKDILIPLELGMDAYWLTKNDSKKYKTIKSIYEIERKLEENG